MAVGEEGEEDERWNGKNEEGKLKKTRKKCRRVNQKRGEEMKECGEVEEKGRKECKREKGGGDGGRPRSEK